MSVALYRFCTSLRHFYPKSDSSKNCHTCLLFSTHCWKCLSALGSETSDHYQFGCSENHVCRVFLSILTMYNCSSSPMPTRKSLRVCILTSTSAVFGSLLCCHPSFLLILICFCLGLEVLRAVGDHHQNIFSYTLFVRFSPESLRFAQARASSSVLFRTSLWSEPYS